jgi:UDP-2,3-diacylglucosamine pyrophosphatase LpxH
MSKLLELCKTDRQREIIQIYEKLGSAGTAKNLDISQRAVNKTVSIVRGYEDASINPVESIHDTSTLYRNHSDDGTVLLQWVKAKADKTAVEGAMEAMRDGLISELPKYEPEAFQGLSSELMSIYPIGDSHIGMLSCEEETGDNFDIKIAESELCMSFAELARQPPSCKEALLINLGDFFHAENMAGVTSKSGNRLDMDGRAYKMIRAGMRVMRVMIETLLRYHEHVRVISLRGNHDDILAMFLSEALYQIYENETRVTIDRSPSVFGHHSFGNTLIVAHHGHTCKPEKIPGVIMSDYRKEFGQSEHCYVYMGHIHNQTVKELPGMIIESFTATSPKDAYAHEGGYRAKRVLNAIVIDKTNGEIQRIRRLVK